jgi:hypothetical protein
LLADVLYHSAVHDRGGVTGNLARTRTRRQRMVNVPAFQWLIPPTTNASTGEGFTAPECAGSSKQVLRHTALLLERGAVSLLRPCGSSEGTGRPRRISKAPLPPRNCRAWRHSRCGAPLAGCARHLGFRSLQWRERKGPIGHCIL